MKNWKEKLIKASKIAERIAFVLAGLIAGYVSTLNLNHTDYKPLLVSFGALCLAFGLAPMFASYVIETWSKK